MSPRRSATVAQATRQAIVDAAVDVAGKQGLQGLSIGRLATELGMSKSGVIGHFGSKERLQLEALDVAIDTFRRAVWEPAVGTEPGRPRLLAICDAWVEYLSGGVFPGGCFLTQAACDFDARPGPVRQKIAGALFLWQSVLVGEVETAIDKGELPEDTDPRQIAFELNSIAVGANQSIQLHGDERTAGRALAAMMRVLGG
jgi:AcrR family transcriptional regulator